MSFQIRPFTEADYPALAQILTICNEETHTVETLQWEDRRATPPCKLARWVAEQNGQVVGFGHFQQFPAFYHPQKFDLNVMVLPSHRRQGIGTALFRQLEEALAPENPISLSAGTLETWTDGVRFLEANGFVEKMRNWESHLDVQAFDPTPWLPLLDEVAAKGYEISTYAELAADPEAGRKLYEMTLEVRRDVPTTDPWTEEPFEVWARRFEFPHFMPEGHFIGIKDGEWVGLSVLWKSDDEGVLTTGLTAIKRAHRGTGIAKALKVMAILFAQAQGCKTIKTWNESNNHRMLAINGQLGFERKPAWVMYTRESTPHG